MTITKLILSVIGAIFLIYKAIFGQKIEDPWSKYRNEMNKKLKENKQERDADEQKELESIQKGLNEVKNYNVFSAEGNELSREHVIRKEKTGTFLPDITKAEIIFQSRITRRME